MTADDDIYSTETFGPIVGVAKFSSFDEAMELANGHGYGLSSSIYTTSGTWAFKFRERISAGMVSVNNSTSGAEAHLPFGGNGKSGNGSRQSGIWVLDQFTRWQSMNWDYAGKLQKAQMDLVELPGDPEFRLELMLLAEALLLLVLDEDKGTATWVTAADQGLAGALLLDLECRRTAGSSRRSVPREPALAAAWDVVAERAAPGRSTGSRSSRAS